MDDGTPWGSDHDHPFTAFSLWLIGSASAFCAQPCLWSADPGQRRALPSHAQVRSPAALQLHHPRALPARVRHFRERYNLVRPHDALGLATPASRMPSPIPFPTAYRRSSLRPASRCARFKRTAGLPIADTTFGSPRPARIPHRSAQVEVSDWRREVLFCHQVVALIDLNQPHHSN